MQEGLSINYVNLTILCLSILYAINQHLLDYFDWLMYYLNVYILGRNSIVMPRIAVEDNSRMSLRILAEEKALLLRAAALSRTDLTDFVLRHALRAATAVIEEADHVQLSSRDSLRVLDLLENPPVPNAKLAAAARALPKPS
jgi:uncharacterized protein (DUF1778 family)